MESGCGFASCGLEGVKREGEAESTGGEETGRCRSRSPVVGNGSSLSPIHRRRDNPGSRHAALNTFAKYCLWDPICLLGLSSSATRSAGSITCAFSTVRREEVAQQQAHKDVDRDENDQPIENVDFHKLRSSVQSHLALRAIERYHNLPENINAWKNH